MQTHLQWRQHFPGAERKISVTEAKQLMGDKLHQQAEMGTKILGRNEFLHVFAVGISEMSQISAYQTHWVLESK